MAKKPHYQQWLEMAEKDFRYACWSLENAEDDYFSFILFYFQQAAEKYLKACIIYKDLSFVKIHDLQELLKTIKQIDPSFSKIKNEVIFLSDFYVDTRYPVKWPTGHTKELALKAQETTQKIRDFVKGKLE